MKKRKIEKDVEKGRIYIVATFNNTLITVTDDSGRPIVLGSCGMYGFSGTRKSTPYAATITTEATLKKVINDYKLKEATVYVKGIGPGREAALRVIKGTNLDIDKIIDITPVPHNGVRPPKLRRV
ncbi:30S ribosomal protein S11 [Candidatus Roizmanbacteria bacterium]|nr:30S ribosomal protein S11 [Candidatus Roizmanbacteria bacterium]